MVPLLYLILLTCCLQHINAYIPPFKSKIRFVSKDAIAFTLGFTIQGSNTTKHIQYWRSNEAYAIALLNFWVYCVFILADVAFGSVDLLRNKVLRRGYGTIGVVETCLLIKVALNVSVAILWNSLQRTSSDEFS